jgi:hypothetical protein
MPFPVFLIGSPKGNRTPVYGVRGLCPRPLDDGTINNLAGGLGFEPRTTESESVVLPLDDPPALLLAYVAFLTAEHSLVKVFFVLRISSGPTC